MEKIKVTYKCNNLKDYISCQKMLIRNGYCWRAIEIMKNIPYDDNEVFINVWDDGHITHDNGFIYDKYPECFKSKKIIKYNNRKDKLNNILK